MALFAAQAETDVSTPGMGLDQGGTMPFTVTEERPIYRASRQREVRCRLWYQVTPYREGLLKFFLVGIQELE